MNLPVALVLAASLVGTVTQRYESVESKQLVPMLSEVIRFATYKDNVEAHAEQKAWLMKTAADFGFVARDAGKVTEIELPAGIPDAPVLGLIIHGDVQEADAEGWTFPPFEGRVENGYVTGRGSADDKGPLIQALLAMKSLKESGLQRTHTIRLLVGSEEESSATEMPEYLKDHAAPDYSLVLDSEFPVVVGEKAWDALTVTTSLEDRGPSKLPYTVKALDAGLGPSIVPDRAEVKLLWKEEAAPARWEPLIAHFKQTKLPEGTRLVTSADGEILRVVVYGKSAHSGVNLTGGRNALVALARCMQGHLPAGGANDLLNFARLAGRDLYGTGLNITDKDKVWGRYGVNVATIKVDPADEKKSVLTINLRRIPPRTAADLKTHLFELVDDFNRRTGAQFVSGGYFEDEPFGRKTDAPLVRKLMDLYERATGEQNAKPAISGGGTYAKRLPNAIAFGMWFPGKPYPGHDVDEKISITDLQRGARVLVYTLTELATGPRIEKPF